MRLLHASTSIPSVSFNTHTPFCSSNNPSLSNFKSILARDSKSNGWSPRRLNTLAPNGSNNEIHALELSCLPTKSCPCGRRHFVFFEAAGLATWMFPVFPSISSNLHSDYRDMLNKIRPGRPDWYEELYAFFLNTGTKAYEAEVARYKTELFSNFKEKKAQKVLEIGIGGGPNLNYYAKDSDVQVVGIDPNRKMEKYAQAAATAAGLPLSKFQFIQAVGEAIPLSDASVDAVVGTLVLCSVKDVSATLQEVKRVLKPGGIYLFVEHVAAPDGSLLRFVQRILDPLQQAVGDGCHLSRETRKYILNTGFSNVDLSMAFLSSATFVNPHVYGIAYK